VKVGSFASYLTAGAFVIPMFMAHVRMTESRCGYKGLRPPSCSLWGCSTTDGVDARKIHLCGPAPNISTIPTWHAVTGNAMSTKTDATYTFCLGKMDLEGHELGGKAVAQKRLCIKLLRYSLASKDLRRR